MVELMTATFEVRYRGFVNVDKPGALMPDKAQVAKAAKLLKSGQKEARAMHPLFARGLDTALNLTITSTGLKVILLGKDGGEDAIVLFHPMHKIAHVADFGTCVVFLVKRAGGGKFKAHSFDTGSAKTARILGLQTVKLCNEIFSKVRRVSKRIKKRAPAVSAGSKENVAADVAAASKLAEAEAETVKKAIDEDQSDGSDASSQDGNTEEVQFLDGVSDQFAAMVVGKEEKPDLKDGNVLESDVFAFGEVGGEADC